MAKSNQQVTPPIGRVVGYGLVAGAIATAIDYLVYWLATSVFHREIHFAAVGGTGDALLTKNWLFGLAITWCLALLILATVLAKSMIRAAGSLWVVGAIATGALGVFVARDSMRPLVDRLIVLTLILLASAVMLPVLARAVRLSNRDLARAVDQYQRHLGALPPEMPIDQMAALGNTLPGGVPEQPNPTLLVPTLDPQSLVGVTETQAHERCAAAGLQLRVSERDGVANTTVYESQGNRVNVVIRDGIVTAADLG